MKTMLIAFVACIAIAVIADVGLGSLDRFTSAGAQSAPSVRLD